MKYDRINSELYVHNRKRFVAAMEESSLAVFNSNDIYPISADSTMPFEQSRDILFLSGVDQEESILGFMAKLVALDAMALADEVAEQNMGFEPEFDEEDPSEITESVALFIN